MCRIVSIAVLFISVLSASTWHVSTSGSDNNDGSQENPFATIQHGINQARDLGSDGDTVFVSAGTYTHYEEFNFYGSSIALVGEDKETTILDGQDSRNILQMQSDGTANASISNFTITKGFSDGASKGAAISISEATFVIHDCIITENNGYSSIIYIDRSDVTISKTEISDNECTLSSNSYGAVVTYFDVSLLLDRCTIVKNTRSGLFSDQNGNHIIKNSIFWNPNASEEIGRRTSESTMELSYTITSTDLYGCENSIYDCTEMSSSDPLFTDYDNRNYTLQELSPAIDAGDPDTDADGEDFTSDLDDQDPDGTRIDIGAYYSHQISGCTDPYAFNYNELANADNGTCIDVVEGCTDPSAFNYNDYDGDGLSNAITGIDGIDVNTDDGSCIPKVYGCMTEGFFNYNPLANIDTEVCYPVITGCIDDENAINYIPISGNPYQDVNDFVPCILPRLGCMDSLAYNYDPLATMHDESCVSRVYGCVDENAFNFDAESNTDDGSCIPIIPGCIDESAFNYNNYGSDKFIGYDLTDDYTNVNTPDDSCIPINEGCLDPDAENYNDFDLDGLANADSSSFDFDPYQKINTHRQQDCFYRPGCTNQDYAQYWNYSLIEGLDKLSYPDTMINFDESCIDIAEFFCNDPIFVEYYIVENNLISTYNMSTNDALVPMQSECISIRIDYCSDSNYEGYYFTDNVIDGSDVDQGANFPISPVCNQPFLRTFFVSSSLFQ